MHGAGLYLYDQHYGFYANTSQLEATNALWQSIHTTSLQVQTFNMSMSEFKKSRDGATAAGAVGDDNADQPEPLSRTSSRRGGSRYSMEPEIAIFTDDESPLYWRLSSGAHHGTEDQVPDPGVHWPGSDPLSWNQLLLIDPVLALGNLGAPVRHYTLNDLLLPPCPDAGAERRTTPGDAPQDQTQSPTVAAGAGCIPLRHLRLVVFTQAHALSDALTNAVHSKLAMNNVTLTFLYAAGVVNRSTGVGLGAAGFQHTTGIASLREGTGGPMPLNVTLDPGVADGKVSGSFGPEISIEPWYYIAEDDDDGGNEKGAYQNPHMTVLARFAAARPSTRPASSPTPRSPGSKSSSSSEPRPRTSPWLVAIARIQMPTHNVVFSATPSVPTPVWREIAENAGVHLYATASNRVQHGAGRAAAAMPRVGDVGIVGTDAIVEVAGSTSLYVAFANEVHWNPWSQRHLKVDRGDAANRACSVQLKGAVQSVRRYLDASMMANSRGHPKRSNNSPSTVLVCQECSTWQQPCNTSVLYVLGAST